MTTMFVFVNTSQERFLLIELDGEYEDKDVRPITDKPIGGGSKKPSTGSGFRILTGSGKPVAKQTAVDETVTVKETENEFLESLKKFSDEAPLSIEDIENIENSTNVDDSRKAQKRNMERPSKGLRILPGPTVRPRTSEQCCKKRGVPRYCIGLCLGTMHNVPRCSKYDDIAEGCWNHNDVEKELANAPGSNKTQGRTLQGKPAAKEGKPAKINPPFKNPSECTEATKCVTDAGGKPSQGSASGRWWSACAGYPACDPAAWGHCYYFWNNNRYCLF